MKVVYLTPTIRTYFFSTVCVCEYAIHMYIETHMRYQTLKHQPAAGSASTVVVEYSYQGIQYRNARDSERKSRLLC